MAVNSAKAILLQEGESIRWTNPSASAVNRGDVIQLPDGRAGVVNEDTILAAGIGNVWTTGVFTVLKTLTMVMLPGSRLFWDYSANKAHLLHGNDKDFFLGSVFTEALSADTTVDVNLNVKPTYSVSYKENGFDAIPISTAGWPHIMGTGEGVMMVLDATVEAQKVDALSNAGLVPGACEVFEALINVTAGGTASNLVGAVGLGNGTHATAVTSITERMLFEFDGNSLKINLLSGDGVTTVNKTDTTLTFAVGTPFLIQLDLRNLADIQCYVNGVLVLASTVFKLDAAVGPLKILSHLAKSSNATTGRMSVGYAGLRGAKLS